MVRADGTGDVPTFQAGADCVLGITCDPPPDTLLVEAGVYSEDVVLDASHTEDAAIVCPSGSSATRLRSVVRGEGYARVAIAGLQVDGAVTCDESGAALQWSSCRFEGDVFTHSYVDRHVFAGCEFRAMLDVAGAGSLDGCLFQGARSRLHLTQFALDVNDCTFEDSADTTLFATPGDETALALRRCTFRRVGRAIVMNPDQPYFRDRLMVSSCRFEDVRDEAISYDAHATWELNFPQFEIRNSRFTRCGAGVRLDGTIGRMDLVMVADTLEDVRGHAVSASARIQWMLDSLVVRRSGAGAIAVLERGSIPLRWLTHSTIEDNAGDAVSIEGQVDPGMRNRTIAWNVLARNGGAGVRAPDGTTLLENLVVGNAGDGLHLTPVAATHDSLVRNTVAANGGSGVRVEAAPSATPVAFVENNLVTQNLGLGIVLAGLAGTAKANDAWRNHLGDYQGVDPDLNLIVDPLYCDPATLDYRVALNSACAPTGTYGQIGAFGSGCGPQVLSVDPRTAAGVVIASVAPNPLVNGREITVSFTLPRPASATMDVLDAGGRRVVSQALVDKAAGIHHVKLRVDDLPPGIYWLRVVQGGRAASSKVAILP